MEAKDGAERLATWFAKHQRDLPWRRDPSPYNVLLSEFILQQTRMEVGLRYYEKLRTRFPTLAALAHAKEASVLAAWSGLGYYSRARNLHKTAREIQRRFDGKVPDDAHILQTLPGIGPYTAGAIASIAYDRPVPSLDGNQYRVLGRLTGAGEPRTAADRRGLFEIASRVLQHGSPRILNQALMDLGSTVCTPETPDCARCPLMNGCATQGPGPRPARKTRAPQEHWRATLHVRDDKVWLVPPKGEGLLGTGWLPPLRRSRADPRAQLEHVFSHRRWRIRTVRSRATPKGPGRWISRRMLTMMPHSSLAVRLLDVALEKPAARTGRPTSAPQT
jgi:A/G-specific adenine glycosylase